MDEKAKMDTHLSSAAAFVEGGIQDACDDACSICLEEFCDSDPSTVTNCKHEFHLQCILEWCQRSAHCPMCWQLISLKDPASQELLEAVEQERNIRANRSRTSAVFHHPVLGDFELQHLPVGADDAEFEERIIQHLAAAAALRRSHRHARREGHSSRSAAQGRPQVLVFSTPAEATSGGPTLTVTDTHQERENVPVPGTISATSSVPSAATEEAPPTEVLQSNHGPSDQVATSPPMNGTTFVNDAEVSNNSQDRAGPSDLQAFSESLKSRFQAASMRYKDSITKNTRGWRERWFSRNTTISDLGSEVRREVNAGMAVVSQMMERLETGDGMGSSATPPQDNDAYSTLESANQGVISSNTSTVVNDGTPASSNTSAVVNDGTPVPCVASSASQ